MKIKTIVWFLWLSCLLGNSFAFAQKQTFQKYFSTFHPHRFPLKSFLWNNLHLGKEIQKQAYEKLHQGDYKGFYKQLYFACTALKNKPQRAKAFLVFGNQLLSLGDTKRALFMYRKVLKMGYGNLSLQASVLGARTLISRNQCQKALKVFLSKEKINSKLSFYLYAYHFQSGVCYQKKKQYWKAYKQFVFAARSFPLLSDVARIQGMYSIQKLNKFNALSKIALAFVKKYPQSPHRVSALFLLGTSLENQKQNVAAIEQYKQIIRSREKGDYWRSKAQFRLGTLYFALDKKTQALEYFEKVARHSTSVSLRKASLPYLSKSFRRDPKVLLNQAEFFYRKGNTNESLKNIARIRRLIAKKRLDEKSSVYEEALFLQARIFFKNRKFRHVENRAQKFLKLFPKSSKKERMELLSVRNQFRKDKSVKNIEPYWLFFKKYPNSTLGKYSFWWAAQLYLEFGEEEKALELFRQYAKQFKSSLDSKKAIYKMGLVYYKLEKYKQTIQVLKSLQKDVRWGGKALFWIGKSHIALKNKRQAYQAWKRIDPKSFPYYAERIQNLQKGQKDFFLKPNQWFQLLSDETREQSLFEKEREWRIGHQIPAPALDKNNSWKRAWVLALVGDSNAFASEIHSFAQNTNSNHKAYSYLLASVLAYNAGFYGKGFSFNQAREKKLDKAHSKNFPVLLSKRLNFPILYPYLFSHYGQSFGVSPLLMLSIVRQESHYASEAISRVGAMGWTQIMPNRGFEIARKLKLFKFQKKHLLNKRINLKFGFFHLNDYWVTFQQQSIPTLAAYNGGPENVKRWVYDFGADPNEDIDAFLEIYVGFRETKNYVLQCLEWFQIMKKTFLQDFSDRENE